MAVVSLTTAAGTTDLFSSSRFFRSLMEAAQTRTSDEAVLGVLEVAHAVQGLVIAGDPTPAQDSALRCVRSAAEAMTPHARTGSEAMLFAEVLGLLADDGDES